MVKLSVNINKFATIRNARGGNNPDLKKIVADCENFGADGITVHPRPDERHIKYRDVYELKPLIKTEFNIEGNPTPDFIKMVLDIKPAQVTLVPDAVDALTSDHGWDTIRHQDYLKDVVSEFHASGIRTSIFLDPDPKFIDSAKATGTDRIELYTESYAQNYAADKDSAIRDFLESALEADKAGLGLNAGHDLNLQNLQFFAEKIPSLLEVSIGHALICDAIYYGLQNTIVLYKRQLKVNPKN